MRHWDWRAAAQGTGFLIILVLALCMDGIMEAYGLAGFTLRAGGWMALAGALILLGDTRPRGRGKKRRKNRTTGRRNSYDEERSEEAADRAA